MATNTTSDSASKSNWNAVDLIYICRKLNACDESRLSKCMQDLNFEEGKDVHKMALDYVCNQHQTGDTKSLNTLLDTLPSEDELDINDSISANYDYLSGKSDSLRCLTQLPTDILIYICQFSPRHQDLIHFMLACRLCCVVGYNDHSVYHIDIIINKTSVLHYQTTRYNYVKSANIWKCISFWGDKLESKLSDTLFSKLKLNPKLGTNLLKLDISNFEQYEEYDVLPPFTSLEKLKIADCFSPWMIFKFIPDATLLVDLELESIPASKELIENITRCVSLKRLWFGLMFPIETHHDYHDFNGLEAIYELSEYIKNTLIVSMNGEAFPFKQLKVFRIPADVFMQIPTDMDLFIYWILANSTQKLEFNFDTSINDYTGRERCILRNFFGPVRSNPARGMLFGDALSNEMTQWKLHFGNKASEETIDNYKTAYRKLFHGFFAMHKFIRNMAQLHFSENLYNASVFFGNIDMHLESIKDHKFDELTLDILFEDGEECTKYKPNSVNINTSFDSAVAQSVKSSIFVSYDYSDYHAKKYSVFGKDNLIHLWAQQFKNTKKSLTTKCFDEICVWLNFGYISGESTSGDNAKKYKDAIVGNLLDSWFVNVNKDVCRNLGIKIITIKLHFNDDKWTTFKHDLETSVLQTYQLSDWNISESTAVEFICRI
eukprot:243958_1